MSYHSFMLEHTETNATARDDFVGSGCEWPLEWQYTRHAPEMDVSCNVPFITCGAGKTSDEEMP